MEKSMEQLAAEAGKRIKYMRMEKGITAQTMAEIVELESAGTYYKKETGSLRLSLLECKKIADFFKMTIDELFFTQDKLFFAKK